MEDSEERGLDGGERGERVDEEKDGVSPGFEADGPCLCGWCCGRLRDC